MALVFELVLDEEQVDLSSSIIKNETANYGAPEENRNAKAEFMVISKNDVNGVPTYLDVDNADPLNQLEYEFPTTIDGWYQFNLLRIPIYSALTTYVNEVKTPQGVITQAASIVYLAATNSVYKAKVNNFNAVSPNAVNGADYWDLVADLSTLIDYPSIVTHVHNDLVDARLRDKARDLMEIALDKFGCFDCSKSAEYQKAQQVLFELDAINSMNWEDKSAQMEEAVRSLTIFANAA